MNVSHFRPVGLFGNFVEILEKSCFRWMFHVFGPSRSPSCFFGGILGHPWAARFRLMFHSLGLLGQFVLHGICILKHWCTSRFRIQYYTFATFFSVWGLTVCFLFEVASNREVSFSMTVSRFRRVQHRLWRFTFFWKFLGAHMGSMLSSSGTRWHPLAVPWVAWVALWRWIW